MIANDQELAMVSRQLHELKTQRDNLLCGGNGQPFQLHVEVAGLEKMIVRLQEEINAYENSALRHDATGDRDKVRGTSDSCRSVPIPPRSLRPARWRAE
jgi:hypothetical protein